MLLTKLVDEQSFNRRVGQFSGKKWEYESFKARFFHCVGRKAMDPGDKLIRLLECLSGTLKKTLERLPISKQGYKKAWKYLDKIFGGDERTKRMFFNRFEELRIRENNMQDLRDLSILLDEAEIILGDVTNESMILEQCLKKLPESYKRQYIKSVIPNELTEF